MISWEWSYREWMARLRVPLPSLAAHRACLYLERHGYRFLKDFGTENARALAAVHRVKCDIERWKHQR